jgi:PLP dependent protein
VSDSPRRDELAVRLVAVRDRISAACQAAGRKPEDVTLIAVTKTFPASDVRLLNGLGVTDFGENRDAEAAPKAEECADLELVWHFVGQLQTNKAASVARYATFVHSVDRLRLIHALGAGARRAGRVLQCLIEVSLDGDPARGGAPADQVPGLAEALLAEEGLAEEGLAEEGLAEEGLAEEGLTEAGLVLAGVMAIAPLGVPPAGAFARLRDSAAVVQAVRPAATVISAGMSGDLEAAITAGATHLRIGTALLGDRRPRVR